VSGDSVGWSVTNLPRSEPLSRRRTDFSKRCAKPYNGDAGANLPTWNLLDFGCMLCHQNRPRPTPTMEALRTPGALKGVHREGREAGCYHSAEETRPASWEIVPGNDGTKSAGEPQGLGGFERKVDELGKEINGLKTLLLFESGGVSILSNLGGCRCEDIGCLGDSVERECTRRRKGK